MKRKKVVVLFVSGKVFGVFWNLRRNRRLQLNTKLCAPVQDHTEEVDLCKVCGTHKEKLD